MSRDSLTPEQLKALTGSKPLTLDGVVIVATHGKTPGAEPLVLTGAELARVLSLRERYNNIYHMADDGDVNLRLRGLAELLTGHVGEGVCQLGDDAAYFLSLTLEDLAARLEADSGVDQFNVFLREKAS